MAYEFGFPRYGRGWFRIYGAEARDIEEFGVPHGYTLVHEHEDFATLSDQWYAELTPALPLAALWWRLRCMDIGWRFIRPLWNLGLYEAPPRYEHPTLLRGLSPFPWRGTRRRAPRD